MANISEEVNLVVGKLMKYNNKNNLSWTKVYKEVLKELNIEDKNQSLLASTVKELTNLGYDIIGKPFKLEKFR